MEGLGSWRFGFFDSQSGEQIARNVLIDLYSSRLEFVGEFIDFQNQGSRVHDLINDISPLNTPFVEQQSGILKLGFRHACRDRCNGCVLGLLVLHG